TGRNLVPVVAPVTAYLDEPVEGLGVGAQHFDIRTLFFRDIGGESDTVKPNALLGFLVEPQLARAARKRGEELHTLHHSSDQRDVAIELPRGVPDHGVELRAIAAVRIGTARNADRPVTVHEPCAAIGSISRS